MIVGQMLALKQHRLIGDELEPTKVVEGRLREMRRTPNEINIFNADEETAAGLARHLLVEERGIGMAEMKLPIGTRRETECGPLHHAAIMQSSCSSQTAQ